MGLVNSKVGVVTKKEPPLSNILHPPLFLAVPLPNQYLQNAHAYQGIHKIHFYHYHFLLSSSYSGL
jgi:hypothetical protein